MKDQNQIDTFFAKGTAGFSDAPADSVWEGIAAELPPPPNRGKRALWILLLLFLIGSGTWGAIELFSVNAELAELDQKVAEQEATIANLKDHLPNGSSQSAAASVLDTVDSNSTSGGEIATNVSPASVSDLSTSAANSPQTQRNAGAESVNNRSNDSDHSNTEQMLSSVESTNGNSSANGGNQNVGVDGVEGEGDPSDPRVSATQSTRLEPNNAGEDLDYGSPGPEISTNRKTKMSLIPILMFEPRPLADGIALSRPIKDSMTFTSAIPSVWRLEMAIQFGLASRTLRPVNDNQDTRGKIEDLDSREKSGYDQSYQIGLQRKLAPKLHLGFGIGYQRWCVRGSYPAKVIPPDQFTSTVTAPFNYQTVSTTSLGGNNIGFSSPENFFPQPGGDSIVLDDRMVKTRTCVESFRLPVDLEYHFTQSRWQPFVRAGLSYEVVMDRDTEWLNPEDFDNGTFTVTSEPTKNFFRYSLMAGVECYDPSHGMNLRFFAGTSAAISPLSQVDGVKYYPRSLFVGFSIVQPLRGSIKRTFGKGTWDPTF